MTGLALPLGLKGSGRGRYAAAMALYQAGEISAEVLEVYRIASARDHQDPAPLLAERGLRLPFARPTAAERFDHLIAETDLWLAFLARQPRALPGLAELRAALNRHRLGPLDLRPQGHPLPLGLLGRALAGRGPGAEALSAAIGAAARDLAWRPCPAQTGAEAVWAGLIGAEAPRACRRLELGLLLVAPHQELRAPPLAGPGLCLALNAARDTRRGPIRTGAAPLLALVAALA